MIPNGEFTRRKPACTLRSAKNWPIRQLRGSGVAFLLTVECLVLPLCAYLAFPDTSNHLALVRLGALVGLAVVYGEVTDRVERLWLWLHTGRGAWVGQTSILLFAGVLVLPTWAAILQAACAYGHMGLRNSRNSTAPAHRWIWSGTTVLLATLTTSLSYHALGGHLAQVGPTGLVTIIASAVMYSAVNLVVLLTGMYLALRPPTLRAIVPGRNQFSYEAAKLLLGLVGAVLLVHAPLLTPAVLLFGALLHRSTLVGELRTVAATDDKTGLLTFRAWREQAATQLTRCDRAEQPAALVLLDLDHFKQLNDSHGHAAGDRILATIGAILTDEVRAQDSVGRYGGEEFVVFLPGATQDRALEIAQRLRARIAGAATGTGAPVTASLGVAATGASTATLEQLIDAADAAMYRAKDRGRNTVCTA